MADFILPSRNQARFAVRSQVNPFPPQNEEPFDTPEATSLLGTPVYDRVILDPKNTDLAEGRLDPDTGLDAAALILDNVTTTVSQTKNIVRTAINGRRGTVKEYIGLGDYQISIRGFLIGPNPNEYPTEDLVKLKRFGDLEKQLVVASRILSEFRVTSMVIDSYVIGQEAGFRNRVPFTLECSSDIDEEIKISANANT